MRARKSLENSGKAGLASRTASPQTDPATKFWESFGLLVKFSLEAAPTSPDFYFQLLFHEEQPRFLTRNTRALSRKPCFVEIKLEGISLAQTEAHEKLAKGKVKVPMPGHR